MVVEARPGLGKDLVEDAAHGQHGRTGVDARRPDRNLAHLAAGGRGAFDDGDVQASRRERERGNEAADSRSDHHHTPWPHAATLQNKLLANCL